MCIDVCTLAASESFRTPEQKSTRSSEIVFINDNNYKYHCIFLRQLTLVLIAFRS